MEHILHSFSRVSIVDFEQVNVGWVMSKDDKTHCKKLAASTARFVKCV